MKRQKKIPWFYEALGLNGMTIKILEQKQAGQISEEELRAKLDEIKKHLEAFRSKYCEEE